MRGTDLSLAEQLRITSLEIVRRKELVLLGPEDVEALMTMRPYIEHDIDRIVEDFYADQLKNPDIDRLIGDAETLRRLKGHMTQYVLSMFEGIYDDVYVHSRLRVGLVHDRIGVSPKLYIASMYRLMAILRRHIVTSASMTECNFCQQKQRALEKIFLFDLTLVFDTYVHALVGQVQRSKDELEQYAQSLEREVARRTQELAEMAQHDPLTGLANQRTLHETLRREIARSTRQGQPLTLAYMDMDHFKAVNDTYGHQEGDVVLRALADAMRTVTRAEDVAARIGGDEYCLMLVGANVEGAREVVQRLAEAFDARKGKHAVTLSVGLASLSPDMPEMADALLRKADKAMYEAKKIAGHAIVASEA